MPRPWCVATLWLLLILGGYRHDLFPPPAPGHGSGAAMTLATSAAPRVCVAPVSPGDRHDAAPACGGRGEPPSGPSSSEAIP